MLRRYGFQYDHLNRLNEAIYQKPETTGADNSYNESINYDRNGNITALSRNGYLDGDGSNVLTIDNLEYVYQFNQLYSVTDYTMSLDGFKDGNQQGHDYDYDANGNMRKDLNKGIQQITYNHLNLPVFLDFGLNKNISYIYNALGVKIIKRVSTPQEQTETVYSNGFQYQNGKLQHFPTAEGYVSVLEGKINYVYNYTDHLGNIRLSYGLDPGAGGQLKIISENHYYPYGLKHSNYNAIEYAYKENELGTYVVLDPTQRSDYRYKYYGMEFQDELGLNLYDMDFRDYDPAIARWIGIDPVTHHNMSPYMAFDGNPVFWADPSGADAIITPDGITFDGADARSAFNGLLNFLDGEDSFFDITGKVVVLSDLQSEGGSAGGGNPQERIYDGNQVLFGKNGLSFIGKANVEYKYTLIDGVKIIIPDSVKVFSLLDDWISPFDSYSENKVHGLEFSPKVRVNGSYIIFESVGTHTTGGSNSWGFNPVAYRFTGVINVASPSKSFIRIKTITGKIW